MKGLMFKLKAMRIKTKDTFDSSLIKELHEEHKTLFNLYEKISNEIENENYKKVLKLLKKFYEAYHLHILKEDKQLYNYLITKFKFFEDEQKEILQKQQEMQEITKFIEEFSNKYNSLEKIKSKEFLSDFKTIGDVLVKRVKYEEEVLYQKY